MLQRVKMRALRAVELIGPESHRAAMAAPRKPRIEEGPCVALVHRPWLSDAEHCKRDVDRPEGCDLSLSRHLQRLDLDAQQDFWTEAHVEREVQPEVTSIEAAVNVSAAGLDLVHGMRVNALEALDR